MPTICYTALSSLIRLFSLPLSQPTTFSSIPPPPAKRLSLSFLPSIKLGFQEIIRLSLLRPLDPLRPSLKFHPDLKPLTIKDRSEEEENPPRGMCKRRKLEHSKVMRWLSGCLIRGVVSPVQFKEADNEGPVPPSLHTPSDCHIAPAPVYYCNCRADR